MRPRRRSEVSGQGLRAVLDRTGEVAVLAPVADPAVLPPAVDDLEPDAVVASYEPPSESVTAAGAPMVVLTWSKRTEDLSDAIAEQTAGNHIRHVMVNLNLSSRTQLCAWAVDHGYARRQSVVS